MEIPGRPPPLDLIALLHQQGDTPQDTDVPQSATTGLKGHAGGVTFHGVFDGDTSDLFISVHLPDGINPKPEILHPHIAYAERRLIWEHVAAHGALPVCNSE